MNIPVLSKLIHGRQINKRFFALLGILLVVMVSIVSAVIVQASSGSITESTSITTNFGTTTTTLTLVSGSVTQYTVVTQTNELVIRPEVSWSNTTITSTIDTSDGTVTITNTSLTTTTITLSTCTVGVSC